MEDARLALILLFLIILFIIIVVIIGSWKYYPRAMDFMFELPTATTNRNGLTTVGMRVKYRYKSITNVENFPSVSKMSTTVLDMLQVSEDYEDHTPWELITKIITQKLYDEYDITGVSVQCSIDDHNFSVFTEGFITPITQF